MNISTTKPIESVAEFLAHAEALEQESVESYEQLADSMEVHNNPEIAELFRKLARFGEKHAAEVRELAAGMTLPQINPWDFKWSTPESPESSGMDAAHYLMDTHQALEIALINEIQGQQFYASVADTTSNDEVRKLAREFADEETEHVELLKEWQANLDSDAPAPVEDLDPPNIPE
ncbi:MAG: ferritin family protein [Chromatiales bacterium]|nr:ferritin family protein [Chromatiales bacterium]